jgi:hypothetical protein
VPPPGRPRSATRAHVYVTLLQLVQAGRPQVVRGFAARAGWSAAAAAEAEGPWEWAVLARANGTLLPNVYSQTQPFFTHYTRRKPLERLLGLAPAYTTSNQTAAALVAALAHANGSYHCTQHVAHVGTRTSHPHAGLTRASACVYVRAYMVLSLSLSVCVCLYMILCLLACDWGDRPQTGRVRWPCWDPPRRQQSSRMRAWCCCPSVPSTRHGCRRRYAAHTPMTMCCICACRWASLAYTGCPCMLAWMSGACLCAPQRLLQCDGACRQLVGVYAWRSLSLTLTWRVRGVRGWWQGCTMTCITTALCKCAAASASPCLRRLTGSDSLCILSPIPYARLPFRHASRP